MHMFMESDTNSEWKAFQACSAEESLVDHAKANYIGVRTSQAHDEPYFWTVS